MADMIVRYAVTLLLAVAVIATFCGQRGNWKGPVAWCAIGVMLVGATAVCVGLAL